jgi:signal transduction histidine kinase
MIQLFCGITGLINFVACLGLSLFLYFKNKSGTINKTFALWSTSVAFWSFGYFMWLFTWEKEQALFWTRILMTGAIIIPSSYLHFTLLFLGVKRYKPLVVLGYLFSGLYVIINFTPLFIQDVEPRYWFRWWPVPGPLYHIFQFFFVGMVLFTHYLLFHRAYFEDIPSVLKKQFRIVAYGTAIAYSGGSTNFFLWYNVPIPPVFNLLVSCYVAFIAYAIINYKLWDLDFIIRKTIVFSGLLSSFVFVFLPTTYGLVWVINTFANVHVPGIVAPILAFSFGVILYRPVEHFLISFTDTHLFQKKFDYQKLLKDASAGISRIKSLHHLLSLVVHFVTMRVRVKNAAVLVFDEKNLCFKLCYLRGYGADYKHRTGLLISEADPLIDLMTRTHAPLDFERVKELLTQGAKTEAKTANFTDEFDFKVIRARMEELQASCCVPSFLGKRIKSVLVLGEKKSGDFYTEQDLNVLYTLAQESAIAVENAQLYDEAIQKTNELERINQRLSNAQTELIQALSETEGANQKLKQTHTELLEAKKRALLAGITAAVGHEIRNPLTPIFGRFYVGYRDLDKMMTLQDKIIDKKAPPADTKLFRDKLLAVKEHFDVIKKNSERIRGIVSTLMNLVKERTGHMAPVQLKLVIASALEEVRFQTYWESLTVPTITQDISGQLPFIKGITQDLQGVFVNLIINSLHALQNVKNKAISIKGMVDPENPKMVIVRFEDNGCGIPPENLERIFEHKFTTKGEKGTGIGLFYCKDNIERIHSGSISVRSEVGRGATFTIKLPICSAEDNSGGKGHDRPTHR